MTPAQKTVAIIGLAGAVVGGSSLLAPRAADSVVAPVTGTPSSPGLPSSLDQNAGFTLKAQPESTHLLRGAGETHVAITLSAPDVDGRRRPPVDVAVVLDRSGSMAGDKLEQAKLAADRLLAQLDERDRFAIVAYGTDVEVVYPMSLATEGHVTSAQRAILQIRDDGGTNMSGGLLAARDQLTRAEKLSGRVARIVLISDGKANEGIVGMEPLAQLANETAQAGMSVTTVGVGLDYDERVMTRMAVAGRGSYYFVESADKLRAMFASELGDLGKTTATQVSLVLEPEAGVEVLEAYGYALQATSRGGRLAYQIPIADLRSGDTRKVVLRLRTDIGDEPIAQLASVRASLLVAATERTIELAASAAAKTTSDLEIARRGQNADAVRHIERAKTAAAIDKATELYEQGEAEKAKQILGYRRSQAAVAAEEIGDQGLGSELDQATSGAEANFDGAGWGRGAIASPKGKRARKANRADAYKLAY